MFLFLCLALAVGQQGVKVLRSGDMGLGLFVEEAKEIGDKVVCVNESLAVHSDDANYLLEYVLDFDDVERLKAFLMYHRFVLKEKSKVFQYLKAIESDYDHPVYYEKEDLDILKSVFEYISIEKFTGLRKKHTKMVEVFKGLQGMNKDLFEFKNYLWASEIVMSRSFISYNKETDDYSYVFIPFIDRVNYWPIPKPSKNFIELQRENEKYCLFSSRKMHSGDEAFMDYSFGEINSFFLNFGFVLQNDPNLSIKIHLSVDPCQNCSFPIAPHSANWDILEKILALMDKDYNPENDFRKFIFTIKDLYLYQDIMTGIMIYRMELINIRKSFKIGLRDLQRQLFRSSGKKKRIINFGIAIRKLIYNHIECLERDLIYGFYTYLFN